MNNAPLMLAPCAEARQARRPAACISVSAANSCCEEPTFGVGDQPSVLAVTYVGIRYLALRPGCREDVRTAMCAAIKSALNTVASRHASYATICACRISVPAKSSLVHRSSSLAWIVRAEPLRCAADDTHKARHDRRGTG